MIQEVDEPVGSQVPLGFDPQSEVSHPEADNEQTLGDSESQNLLLVSSAQLDDFRSEFQRM